MDEELNEANYGENTLDDMYMDYDYHVNTGELDDWFQDDEPNPDNYADWD